MKAINNSSTHLTSRKKAILIYVMVSLFLAFEMAIQVSPSVMASDLMHSLGISAFSLGIMSSVYFYSYTSMQIPSGLLFDRFNARNIIFSAVIICSVGAILFGCITNFYLGCVARLLMGIGSAFAFVSVLIMASRLFHSKWFPLLAGITQMLAALGAMFGQIGIRLMVNNVGWRESMYILGVFGIALAFFISMLLHNYSAINSHENSSYKGDFTNIRSSLKLIIVNPQTWIIGLYAFLLWAPMSGFASLWGVLFLEKFDGLSISSATFYCSMMWLGLAVGSPMLGLLSTLMNSKTIPLILSALLGVISFGFIICFHMNGPILALSIFLAGAACSGQALSFDLVKDNNPQHVKATAIAFNNMAVVASGAIFQPVIGWGLHLNTSFSNSFYQISMLIITGTYFLGFIISYLFIKSSKDMNDIKVKDKKLFLNADVFKKNINRNILNKVSNQ